MADPAPTPAPAAAPAAAAKPAAPVAPPAPPRDLRNPAMKELFAKVQSHQKRLGWSDAKLCEFATQTIGPIDPYARLKVTTVEFLQRIRPTLLVALVAALEKAR